MTEKINRRERKVRGEECSSSVQNIFIPSFVLSAPSGVRKFIVPDCRG
jgi:hypothetical protein